MLRGGRWFCISRCDMTMMTIQQAVELAIGYHRAGQLAQAEAIYQQILQNEPNHPDALHLLGTIHLARGEIQRARDLIEKAIAANPQQPEFHGRLGNVHQSRGALDEALACYRKALELRPDYAEAHFSVGLILHAQGDMEGSIAAYRKAIEINPAYPSAYNNLGNILRERGDLAGAGDHYRKAIEIDPRHASAQNNLGNLLLAEGRIDEALSCYDKAIAAAPDRADSYANKGGALRSLGKLQSAETCLRRAIALDGGLAEAVKGLAMTLSNLARHEEAITAARRLLELQPESADAWRTVGVVLEEGGRVEEAADHYRKATSLGPAGEKWQYDLAAISGSPPPPIAPRQYMIELFDDYSARFEQHLVEELKYQAPQRLYDAVMTVAPDLKPDILDLGCGTGLSAQPFALLARSITGVDLAPRMIELARRRGIYTRLVCDDVITVLQCSKDQYDLILAADLLIYVGDQRELFGAVRGALRTGGLFAFSIEVQEEDGYTLRPTRRYTHSLSYVRAMAKESGIAEMVVNRGAIRRHAGKDVEGLFIVLRKGG
jgi:predicted TPR repeat methyltransferase